MARLPTDEDFPKTVKLSVTAPPGKDSATNVLILLHGLGDRKESFANLAKQMKLPETACISLQGPQNVLGSDESFHWGDDIIFDSTTGGLDPDAGFKQTDLLLKSVLVDVLVGKCGYKFRDIVIFGFAQGGMAALNAAVELNQPSFEPLGGIISVGAPLPGSTLASLEPKCKIPVLVCAGASDSSVTQGAEDKLKRVFEFVEVARYRKPGDSMPSNRDEMMPIMQFFARRLRSTKGVPAGSVEIALS